jgi:hypothetical protein
MQVKEVMALRGWWFGGDALPHGDGRPVEVGTVHEVAPPIVPCKRGLHCSRHALQEQEYAGVATVWRVEVWGEVIYATDKLAASHRRYLCRMDATDILRRFACREALRVLPADAPAVVREYLLLADKATDEQRDAARDAAWDAARDAARDAAWDAAWDAEKKWQYKRLREYLDGVTDERKEQRDKEGL